MEEQVHLKVQKTARVYTYGNISEAKEVWVLFHGYGHNIHDFFEPFKSYGKNNAFIVPEGLSKFYQKGFNGKVGSSWMTKEDRALEIQDALHYFETIIEHFQLENKNINIFGFSQGGPMAARWVNKFDLKYGKVIFWSTYLSEEELNLNSKIRRLKVQSFFSKTDQFVNAEQFDKYFSEYPYLNPTEYKGNHYFSENDLAQFFENV